MELARDLMAYVDAGPSPFHAVAETARRLEAEGFVRLDEREVWDFAPGDRRYVVRDGGSIAAFRVGSEPSPEAGFRLVGAHTDSPTLKVRPVPDVRTHGYRRLGVEPYGGVLLHTWLDRDLTLAGRVVVREGDKLTERLAHLPGALLRIPSLAIHLSPELREQGLRLDPQKHAVPVWSHDGDAAGLAAVLAAELDVDEAAIRAFDLVTADTQGAALGGDGQEWVLAPRLDNLASCHAGLHALLRTGTAAQTQVLIATDHEEVGSASAEGAAGTFLADVLERVTAVTSTGGAQDRLRALARSRLVSADMAHALHPNYPERHEPQHQPRLGGGPVLKVNANQSYATDAGTAAWFAQCCADAGAGLQRFTVRADMPCGSTIGPLTATRLGIPTVDVGNPLLSMHSCREQVAVGDIEPMIAALTVHLERPDAA